jgi:hypothetical protein
MTVAAHKMGGAAHTHMERSSRVYFHDVSPGLSTEIVDKASLVNLRAFMSVERATERDAMRHAREVLHRR